MGSNTLPEWSQGYLALVLASSSLVIESEGSDISYQEERVTEPDSGWIVA